jgi:Ca2+-binding RTX toxin-like protein
MRLFEPLERRRLLSVSFNPATGLLTATETPLSDVVRIERSGKNLLVHEGRKTSSFILSKVTGIVVNGGGGNDYLSVDQNVKIPATLNGEGGNDTLVSGGGADLLSGGPGTDTADYSGRSRALTLIIGGGPVSGESGEGDNISGDVENLIGGRGSDSLVGSAGPNIIDGGRGDDSINGGGGNDQLIGGKDDDTYIFLPSTVVQQVRVVEVTKGGDDTLDFSALDASTPVTADLEAVVGGNFATYTNTTVVNAGQKGDVENVIGGSGNDSISGHNGNNILIGGPGNDSIYGLGGPDYIDGGEGDDYIDGGTGADDIHGGPGNDTVDYSGRTADLNVSADDIANDGEAGEGDNVHSDVEEIIGGAGNDQLTGSPNGSILIGNGGMNTLIGLAAADVIFAGPNGDLIIGNGGADLLFGGAGNDTIFAGDSTGDPLAVGPAPSGIPGANIFGAGGNDSIVGGVGDDFIDGQDGNDTIHGGSGNDTVYGETGADYLFGDFGDDSINGGIDNDSIGGGAGNDTVDAGDGDDLVQKDLADPVTGVTSTAPAGVPLMPVVISIDPITNDDNPPLPDPNPPAPSTDPGPGDSVDGGTGNDTLIGGPLDDTLNGDDGSDSIVGNDGNDVINGNDGDNTMVGGNGDDTIGGGTGSNQMEGDAGDDVFINGNGLPDTVDGGDGTNIAQFDPAGEDSITNIQIISDPEPAIISSPVDGAGGSFTNLITDAPPSPILQASVVDSSIVNDITPVTSAVALDGTGTLTIDDSAATTAHTVVISQSGTNLVLSGTDGSPTFPIASVKKIVMLGGSGADFFWVNGVNIPVSMNGGAGDDSLIGGSANDTLVGGDGNDHIEGQLGNDSMEGDNGNDSLFGGPGNDYMDGGTLAFQYAGGDGDDLLDGGDGNDWAEYQTRTDNLTIRLDGTNRSGAAGEHDTINANVENAMSGSGNDTLIGNSVANYLDGGYGTDAIFGLGGNDQVVGDFGATDSVYGGAGSDFIYVKDGAVDRYAFASGDNVTRDAGDTTIPDQAPPP